MNNILTIKVFFGNIERGCAFDKKLSISAKDTELTNVAGLQQEALWR